MHNSDTFHTHVKTCQKTFLSEKIFRLHGGNVPLHSTCHVHAFNTLTVGDGGAYHATAGDGPRHD